MFYHRERCLTTICKENGERARGTEASKEVSDQVLKKGRDFFSDNVMVNDTRYFGYYMPIKDSKNNISGMMFAGKPRKDILIEMSKSIAIIFCAAFITIIIAANIVFHYGKRVIGSLNQIKKFLKDIAEGDLTTKIDSKILDRQDEIGQMGRFSVMLKDSITDLVGKDPLTRLHNRRSCQVVLDSFENKYKKDGKDFVIAIGDIDFFKQINDRYGHLAGDKVLQDISNIISSFMEYCGFVFRWGGEEFLLIFENMTIEETRLCVQEFMDEVSASKIMWKDQEIMLTMTFGIAGTQEKDSLYKVIQLADSRLYKGKKQGRNRIIEGD